MENVPQTQINKGLAHFDRLDPRKEIEFGKKAADALIDVVKQAKLSRKLGGDKEHLQFEAWQTVGQFYNATPKVEWSKEVFGENGIVIGYNSRAVVLQRGEVIGAAEAYCGRDEEKWNTRPKYESFYVLKDGTKSSEDPPKDKIVWIDNPKNPGKKMPKRERVKTGDELVPLFQLKSMSQTRAQAKALRSCFAWVVVLAGYQPTPLEEMDGVYDAEIVDSKEESQPDKPKPDFDFLKKMGEAKKAFKELTGSFEPYYEVLIQNNYEHSDDVKAEDREPIYKQMQTAYKEMLKQTKGEAK